MMNRIRGFVRVLILAVAVVGAMFVVRWVAYRLGVGGFFSGVLAALLLGVGAYRLMVWRAKQVVARIRAEKRRILPDVEVPALGTAVYGWKVRNLDGSLFAMNEVRGEVVFLNFWATMCIPCVKELASIENLHEALSMEGVVFMCVASDDDLGRLQEWVGEHRVTVPVFALASEDLPSVFDSDYVPSTYIIAPDGRIALHHEGAGRWDDPRVKSFLRSLLAEEAIAPAGGAGAAGLSAEALATAEPRLRDGGGGDRR